MDELTGTLVVVHPQLPSDPAGKQGKLGIITSADLERDDVYVSFNRGEQALYSADALLVLKEPNTMYRDLITGFKEIAPRDIKALFQINLLQQQGGARQLKTAMELALTSDTLLKHSMTTLDKHLGLEQAAIRQAQQAPAAKIGR